MEIAAETAETPETIAVETPTLCSKCKTNPRADADSTNPWCNDCKTKYQREYMQTIKKLTTEQAYARGITALRNFLVGEFERLGSGSFTGYEIAELIRHAQLKTD